jgi:hypothetical protein
MLDSDITDNSYKINDFKSIRNSVETLNKHGASIDITLLDDDCIMIKDIGTSEIYFEGKYFTWLAMVNLLGYNRILKRIS